VYFGNEYDIYDKQTFQFGCVVKETNLFYTQEADGIMGLTRGSGNIQPIYQQLYDQKLVEHNGFSL